MPQTKNLEKSGDLALEYLGVRDGLFSFSVGRVENIEAKCFYIINSLEIPQIYTQRQRFIGKLFEG